ncbi:hotdog domain-containing protein [Rhodococcus aetherivorans]
MHGGFSAHLLDCMLGILMQARGSRSLTASLDLRYLRRTSLDEPLDLYSRIVEIEGRKTVAGVGSNAAVSARSRRGECSSASRNDRFRRRNGVQAARIRGAPDDLRRAATF